MTTERALQLVAVCIDGLLSDDDHTRKARHEKPNLK